MADTMVNTTLLDYSYKAVFLIQDIRIKTTYDYTLFILIGIYASLK